MNKKVMNVSELQTFLTWCDHRVKVNYWEVPSQAEKVLGTLAKITEELGELAEQVMKRRGRQHKAKGKFEMEHLEDELADVILAATTLSVDLDFNLEKALQRKMEKVKKKLQ